MTVVPFRLWRRDLNVFGSVGRPTDERRHNAQLPSPPCHRLNRDSASFSRKQQINVEGGRVNTVKEVIMRHGAESVRKDLILAVTDRSAA